MSPYSFLPLFTERRFYPLALQDSTTATAESGSKLNTNVSLFSSDNALLNSGGSSAGIIIFYLLIILALVAVLFFVRKFLLKKVKVNFNTGKRMRVSDKIIIGQDKQIMMVELAEKMMIVGVTGQTISQLALLEKDECAEFTEENAFGNILSDKLGAIKRQSGANDASTDVMNNDE